jgi:MFS family permease
MTEADRVARTRYFLMVAVNLAAALGAVLGLLILGRASQTWQTLLGIALVLAALYVIAVVPRSLARRWRTPEQS